MIYGDVKLLGILKRIYVDYCYRKWFVNVLLVNFLILSNIVLKDKLKLLGFCYGLNMLKDF